MACLVRFFKKRLEVLKVTLGQSTPWHSILMEKGNILLCMEVAYTHLCYNWNWLVLAKFWYLDFWRKVGMCQSLWSVKFSVFGSTTWIYTVAFLFMLWNASVLQFLCIQPACSITLVKALDYYGLIMQIGVCSFFCSFASGGEDGYVRLHHFDPDYFNIKI